jgi:thiol-disulfide isomerase/thioredoxin
MRILLSLLALAFSVAAHAAPPAPAVPAEANEAKPAPAPRAAEKPVLLGAITREQVEAAVPDWVQAEVESAPDPAAVQALSAVPPGAEVVIYMGSWCGDSRREVSRLWRTLDNAGGSLPCKISYIGVDRTKKEPAALIAGSGMLYVPTLIVKRDGHEVGRIVESAPHGVEQDLLALLSGTAQGLLTTRPDRAELAPEKHP